MIQKVIGTERLKLETIQMEDAEFIRALVNTKGWLEFIGDRNVHSLQDAIQYITRIQQMPNFTYWVVRIKQFNIPIGIISFLKRSYLDHFDIGFAFLPEYAGKGYAYEAAKEVISLLSTEPSFNPILATTVPQNVSSIKLLNKLGLRFEKEIDVNKEKLHVYTTEPATLN